MFVNKEYLKEKYAKPKNIKPKRLSIGICVGFLLIASMFILPTLESNAQACNLSLQFPATIETNAGTNLTISGFLYNSASSPDMAIISVSSPSNWLVSVTPSSTFINGVTNVSLTVSCSVPSGVNPGHYEIMITAKSNITLCTTFTNISIIVDELPSQGELYVSLDVSDYDNENIQNDLLLLAEFYDGTSYIPASNAFVYIDNSISNWTTDYNGSFIAYDFSPGAHFVHVIYMNSMGTFEWDGSFYIENYSVNHPNETYLELWTNPADLDSERYLNDLEIYAYFVTELGYTYPAAFTEIYIDQIYMGTTDSSGYFTAFGFSAGYHYVYAYYYQFYYNGSLNYSQIYTAYSEFYSEGLGEEHDGIYLSVSVCALDSDGLYNDAIFSVYYYSTYISNSTNSSGGRQSAPPNSTNETFPEYVVIGAEIYVDYYFIGYTDAQGSLIRKNFTPGWHFAEAYYLISSNGGYCNYSSGSNCTSYIYDNEWFYSSGENTVHNLGVSAYTFANDADDIVNDVLIKASYYASSANYSSPASQLEVYVEGIFVGYTSQNGTWNGYNYLPGVYNVLVFGNNCSATTTFTIQNVSSNSYAISAYVLNLDNEMTPNDVKIVVKNSVGAGLSNASIYIDWLFYGTTNILGELIIFDLAPGYHIATWFNGIFIDEDDFCLACINSSINSSYVWSLAWENVYSTTFYIPYSASGNLSNWSFQPEFCMADFDNDTYLDDLVIVIPIQGNFSASLLNISIDGNKVNYSYQTGRGSGERIVVYDLAPGLHEVSVTYSGASAQAKIVSRGTGQQFIYAIVYQTNADSGIYRNDAQILIRDQDGKPVQAASINIDNTIIGITNSYGVYIAYNLTNGTHSGSAIAPNGKTTSFVINSEGLENRAPIANAGSDFIVNLGSEALFNGSKSVDPDGDLLSFVWNFGDGNTANGIVVKHTYTTFPSNGEYTVTLTVTDPFGASAISVIKVRIAPVSAKVVGSKIIFDGFGSTDEDNDALTYTWDFGDGSTSTGANPTHVYSKPGSYDVKLTVSDGKGGASTAVIRVIIKEKATTVGYPVEIIMLLIGATLGAVGVFFFFRRKKRTEKI
ncbi:MAG: PKD domain-containing protein [Thermoplasmata archaeon]